MREGDYVIWPQNAGDKLVKLDRETYFLAKEEISRVTASSAGSDTLWEVIRKVMLSERANQEKRERHERGDYSVELTKAEGIATDMIYRTDGTPYEAVCAIREKLTELIACGFTTDDIDTLKVLHEDMVMELHKTDEMAVSLMAAISELEVK